MFTEAMPANFCILTWLLAIRVDGKLKCIFRVEGYVKLDEQFATYKVGYENRFTTEFNQLQSDLCDYVSLALKNTEFATRSRSIGCALSGVSPVPFIANVKITLSNRCTKDQHSAARQVLKDALVVETVTNSTGRFSFAKPINVIDSTVSRRITTVTLVVTLFTVLHALDCLAYVF
ncbi:hypothetical protein D915_009908 [Fasciola hepatica]|uniref:SEA domain protein n=1 Tax=Fasciola hepatica TaxID=6192 RepID=A0A4E0RWE9_FASHE|nr:hypothetical protein D915_009908 [Fasciola hepatica]